MDEERGRVRVERGQSHEPDDEADGPHGGVDKARQRHQPEDLDEHQSARGVGIDRACSRGEHQGGIRVRDGQRRRDPVLPIQGRGHRRRRNAPKWSNARTTAISPARSGSTRPVSARSEAPSNHRPAPKDRHPVAREAGLSRRALELLLQPRLGEFERARSDPHLRRVTGALACTADRAAQRRATSSVRRAGAAGSGSRRARRSWRQPEAASPDTQPATVTGTHRHMSKGTGQRIEPGGGVDSRRPAPPCRLSVAKRWLSGWRRTTRIRLGYQRVDDDPNVDVLLATMDGTAGWFATLRLRSWERAHLRLSKGERLLDVGCGLGEASLELAEDLGSWQEYLDGLQTRGVGHGLEDRQAVNTGAACRLANG